MRDDTRVLLLLDIDGTLLLSGSAAHRDAVHDALRSVYRIVVGTAGVDAAGRTDAAIARSLLLLADVSAVAIDDGMGEWQAAACEAYARRCPPDLSDRVAPGAAAALEQAVADGHRLSLVTGNLETIAHLKLARAGLGRFFARGQGGFGSDDEDRAALPEIARARAGGPGTPHPRADTVVIGDTPRDIACARADGVRCVAVATGSYAAGDLSSADAVIGSLAELPAALAALPAADADARPG